MQNGKREDAGEAGKTKKMALTNECISAWQQDRKH